MGVEAAAKSGLGLLIGYGGFIGLKFQEWFRYSNIRQKFAPAFQSAGH